MKKTELIKDSWLVDGSTVFVDTRYQVCCGKGRNECCGDADVAGDYYRICAVDNPDHTKLISAAPDLFSELHKIVSNAEQSDFEDWLSSVSPSGDAASVRIEWEESANYIDFCNSWSGAISAIAKATGEK